MQSFLEVTVSDGTWLTGKHKSYLKSNKFLAVNTAAKQQGKKIQGKFFQLFSYNCNLGF